VQRLAAANAVTLPEICAWVGVGGPEKAAVFDYAAPGIMTADDGFDDVRFRNGGYGRSISSSSFQQLAASGFSTTRHMQP
jgi:hypothetical protein